MKNEETKRFLIVGFLIVAFFVFGIYIGERRSVQASIPLANTDSLGTTEADFEPFWKVWRMINEKYPGTQPTDQDKIYGAIKGLVSSLDDPYSVFMTPEESKNFEADIKGEFGGVGIEIGMKEKVLTVISALKDTPAEKAGIKSGDKIIKIDDKLTADMTIDEAITIIRGDIGTNVKITIFRDGEIEPREFNIVRGKIIIPTIDQKLRDDGIYVISLYNFSGNSNQLFRGALNDFQKSKSKKLILDLRGNPGGYLESAIDMASWFLPAGKTVVIEDKGPGNDQVIYRSKGYNTFGDIEMVILVDGGTASAAEILAGALGEHGKAKIVGTKTYGKGSVQELLDVTRDTSLKITIAKWLTPNKVSISENGLKPDYIVEITKEHLDKGIDPQMDKAVELLK